MGSDSKGSKINRKGLAGKNWICLQERRGRLGDNIHLAMVGGGGEKFLLPVLSSPLGIWEILTSWNTRVQAERQKLRIVSAGNSVLGNPAVNSSWEVVEAKVGNNSIGGSAEGNG